MVEQILMKAICLPVWNRVDKLKEILRCLQKQRGIESWKIFIQIDPSNKMDQIIFTIKNSNLPCNINIQTNSICLGVRGNTFKSIERAFQEGAEHFLYLEEDLEISDDALDFVNLSLSIPNFQNRFIAGNLHFSGCSNHAHIQIPKKLNPAWKHIGINSQFISSYGLFFCRKQFETFISRYWWNHPLKIRDLRGNKGAGWDYSLSEAVLDNNLICLQSLLPRVRHNGIEGVHCTPDEYQKGWDKADLWTGHESLKTIFDISPNESILGELGAFVTMASQCWTLQKNWLKQDKNLVEVAKTLKSQLL